MTDGKQTERYVAFLTPFEIDRQLYPKENILFVVPKKSRFVAELRLL